jgi:hypothetical protein
MPAREVTPTMPGTRKLHRMADSQLRGAHLQKRDAFCTAKI